MHMKWPRVALVIARLPGMTPKLFNGFRKHHTRLVVKMQGGGRHLFFADL